MKIKKTVYNSVIISEKGKEFLGLNTYLTDKGIAGTKFSDIRKNPGYICNSDGTIKKFNLPEIGKIDSDIILYSNELDLDLNIEKMAGGNPLGLRKIINLLNFILELEKEGMLFDNIPPNLFYTLNEEQILMFPPRIIAFLNKRGNLADKDLDITKYSHPVYDGEMGILYSIGIMVYEELVGEYPISYSTPEDLRDKMRRNAIILPRWKNNLLNDQADKFIKQLLLIEDRTTLHDALETLISIENDGFLVDSISDNDIRTYRNEMELFTKKENLREFTIKNRTPLLIGLAIFLFLLSFFGTMIKTALAPPQTTGFSQVQVVESYFNAFQTLDTYLLDDVLAKDVRKTDERELSTVYVTSKMRTQMGDNDASFTPKKWLMLPKEKQDVTEVYGIYNPVIEPIDENRFKVSYEKWFSTPESEDPSEEFKLIVEKIYREEIFTLQKTKYSYEIVNIETLKESIRKETIE